MYASNLVGRKYKRRSWVQDKYFFLRGLSTRKCLKSVSQETEKLHIVFIGPISNHCLGCQSVRQSLLILNCAEIVGFVKVVTWISLNCYLDLSKLIHVFLLVVTLNRHFLFASLQEFQSAFFSTF